MSLNFLNKLKSSEAYMSAIEKKISLEIIKDPKKFISYSLSELSLLIGVSQGSIVNFANKYADGGFPELKLKVASSSSIENKVKTKTALSKRVYDVNQALVSTEVNNDVNVIEEVANLILSAKRVEIYGVYRSAVVATDMYYHLLQLGINANFVSDVLTCAVSASLLTKESVVVAVSSSGRTKDVIDAVKLAKENGVKVVCITANKNSPLAKLADFVLVACSSGDNEFSPWEIRLSQLVISDAICEHVSKVLNSKGKLKNETMTKILSSHNVSD